MVRKVVRYCKVGRLEPNVREIYPSQYANKPLYQPDRVSCSDVNSETETRSIYCQQCAAPIEDSSELAECWFCESDNFLGRDYNRR